MKGATNRDFLIPCKGCSGRHWFTTFSVYEGCPKANKAHWYSKKDKLDVKEDTVAYLDQLSEDEYESLKEEAYLKWGGEKQLWLEKWIHGRIYTVKGIPLVTN